MNFFKILLVIVLFPTIVEAQKDTIFWQENTKLKFEDFKKVPLIGKIRAISHFEYPCKYKWKQDTMYLTTKLCFIKSLSFFNKDSLSIRKVKVLEKHEQGHFDIAEIEMRKLRVKFKQAKLNNQNISSIFKLYIEEYIKALKVIQDIYDKETNLSMNEKKQLEWETKIKKELDASKEYSNPIIKIYWK